MKKMSDVAGIEELEFVERAEDAISGLYQSEFRANVKRLEALLRNRQELVDLIEVIQELSEAEILDADKIDELYAKAKELDND